MSNPLKSLRDSIASVKVRSRPDQVCWRHTLTLEDAKVLVNGHDEWKRMYGGQVQMNEVVTKERYEEEHRRIELERKYKGATAAFEGAVEGQKVIVKERDEALADRDLARDRARDFAKSSEGWEQKYSNCLMSHNVQLMAASLVNHQAREALGAIQSKELLQSPTIFEMVIKALGTSQSKGERVVAALEKVCKHARVGDELKVREALLALKKVEEE